MVLADGDRILVFGQLGIQQNPNSKGKFQIPSFWTILKWQVARKEYWPRAATPERGAICRDSASAAAGDCLLPPIATAPNGYSTCILLQGTIYHA
ncbi:hypothetical protein QQP08_003695 [Theobroma cacao]|uniref:Uncharacterized protein n=1 Tax=Theobroma cacao TaxID=3641 RepID=A0A061E2V1_THECC|nr:Uncharacterized protein TCM_005820 [Theobroma cacao]WRX11208.1 hypothetical protein QQP08_003695 [Theobroma cacao]